MVFSACGANVDTPAATDTPAPAPASTDTPAPSAASGKEPVYQKIAAAEAHEMMEQSAGFILLDVRTESEFKEKRIEGAILIPGDEIESRAEAELPDKAQLIFVYCRSGARSATATNVLVKLGYTNVYDIGGINDWPYETVSG